MGPARCAGPLFFSDIQNVMTHVGISKHLIHHVGKYIPLFNLALISFAEPK